MEPQTWLRTMKSNVTQQKLKHHIINIINNFTPLQLLDTSIRVDKFKCNVEQLRYVDILLNL